ncbi:MAG: PrsW family glutamic-type intramembrane protease [Candidatus Paceibacterota bacterium]
MLKRLTNNIKKDIDIGIYRVSVFITGLVLPIVLIFIINFTGQSEIIEEIGKVLVILFIILRNPSWKIRLEGAVVFGLLFGLSENMFYLINFLGTENYHIFLLRFVTTIPIHIVTVLIIFIFTEIKKYFWIFGLILSILVHLLFNLFV